MELEFNKENCIASNDSYGATGWIKQISYDGNLLGSEMNLELGVYTKNGESKYHRINFAIKIDDLDKNAIINSITLKLFLSSTANQVALFRETAIDSEASDEEIIELFDNTNSGYLEVDLTKYFVEHINETLYFSIKSTSNVTIFTPHAIALRPIIEMKYKDERQVVLNESSFIKGAAGKAGSYAVNILNGKLFFNKELFSKDGNLMPINLSLFYDEGGDFDSINGLVNHSPNRWRFNYEQYIIYLESLEAYNYVDGIGVNHLFFKALNSNNVYYDISGTGLILTVNSNGYVIEDENDNYLDFNSNGLLTSIRKVIGNNTIATNINYQANSLKISSITDGMGNSYVFAYSDDLIVVSKSDSQDYGVYKNITNKELFKITEPKGRQMLYTYDDDGAIISAKSDNGEMVEFSYDGNKKIKTITESIYKDEKKVVKSYTFEYRVFGTMITDNFGVKRLYSYNEAGQVVGICDVKEDENENIVFLEDNHLEKYKGSLNIDKFLEFEFNNSKTLSLNCDEDEEKIKEYDTYTLNNFEIEAFKEYVVNFSYLLSNVKISNNLNVMGILELYQEDKLVFSYPFDKRIDYLRAESFVIKTTKNSSFKLKIITKTCEGLLTLKNFRIYEYKETKEYTCINQYTNYDPITGDNITWFKTGEYICFTHGTANTLVEGKMYYNDLVSTIKNLEKNETYNLWYDNKKGLIHNTTNAKIIIGNNPTYNLSETKVAKVLDNGSIKQIIYNDYAANESISQFFCKNSNVVIMGNNRYTNYSIINTKNQIVKERNYDGIYCLYTYDDFGNLLTEELYDTNSLCIKVANTYNNYKFVSKRTTYNGGTTSNTYYTYDLDRGVLTKIKESNGNEINYTYDSLTDELIKVDSNEEDVNKNEIEYTKDLVTKYKNNGFSIGFSYDEFNSISSVTLANNTFLNFNNTIESTKKTSTITYPNNYSKTTITDKYNRVTKINDKLTTNTYSNNLLTYIYCDNDTSTLTNVVNPSDSSLKVTSNSKLRKIIDNYENNKKFIYYNELGQMNKITNSSSSELSEINYTYDSHERITNEQLIKGNLNIDKTFTYKGNNAHPSNEVVKDYTLINFTYDDDPYTAQYYRENIFDEHNRVETEINYLNKYVIKRIFSYKTSGSISSYLVNKIQYYVGYNTTPTYNGYHSYTYDTMGNISDIFEFNSANALVTKTSYGYDDVGRLIREDNQKLNKTTIITYDQGGNIVSKKVGSYTTGGLTTYTTYEYTYHTTIKDRLISYNNKAITYDSYGNPISYDGNTYTWSKGNKLSKIVKNGIITNFEYNANGIRTRKYQTNTTTNEHKYILNGSQIIAEEVTKGSSTYRIYYIYANNDIIGIIYKQKRYFFKKNLQNDIIGIYNDNGSLIATYVYDAFGNHVVYNSSGVENTSDTFIGNINPFRYRSYYYDVETQLYWVSSRYYSPELCRWISPDSIEYLDPESINGLNLYAYCGNDPINRYDPSGHFWDYVLDAVFIGIGIYDFVKDPSWSKGLWLAADVVLAVLPFVPALSSARHLGKIDNVIDAASALNKIDNVNDAFGSVKYVDDAQEIGTYLLKNVDGDVIYVGKGSRNRMMKNFNKFNADSFLYYPAKNIEMAFANEAYFMGIYGGAQSMMKNYRLVGGYERASRLLNKINSPGLRYLFYWF